MTSTNYLLFILLPLLFTACSGSEQTLQQTSKPEPREPVTIERSIVRDITLPGYFEKAITNGTRTENGKPGAKYWTNYTNYNIEVTVEPADTMLYGSAHIEYINNSPDTLRIIAFELSQNVHAEGNMRNEPAEITGGIHLSNIKVDGTELEQVNRFQPGYVVQGTNLFVILPKAVMPNQSEELEIDWSFKIPQAGAGARMGYSQQNLFYLAYWYPHVAVYDDLQGWFVDQFLGNAEFYHGFGNYDLSITVPEQWIVMSTGILKNAEEMLAPNIFHRYQDAANSDSVITIVSQDDFGEVTPSSASGLLTWKFSAENVRDVAFSVTKESQWDGTRTPVGDINGDGEIDYTRIPGLI